MADFVPVKLFAETVPLQLQMRNMSRLRDEDPERAREIFITGQQLIQYAANGELRALKKKVYEIEDETGIFPYFGSKMLKESLVNGHLLVSLFIIENGYPLKNKSYPSVMHEVLETENFPDYLGAGVVGFLSTQGCDVDRQISGSWLTPLHIAVRRNLVQTVATLISLGADVNAVGKDDVMPLSIAQQQKCDIEDSEKVAMITKLLEENGAKATLKELLLGGSSDVVSSSAASMSGLSFSTSGVPFTTNSMVSVKVGGSGSASGHLKADPKGQEAMKATPVTLSSSGGVGSNGNFVRFTGAGGGPTPVIASGGPKPVYTRFSSSAQAMNEASENSTDASTAVSVSDSNPTDSVPTVAYSSTSDDGGLMFSTS